MIIGVNKVKFLRNLIGQGVMKCKSALVKTNGNVDEACYCIKN